MLNKLRDFLTAWKKSGDAPVAAPAPSPEPEPGQAELPAIRATPSSASLGRLDKNARYFFDVEIDPAKEQSVATLTEAFKIAGFDPGRPRWDMGSAAGGFSYFAPDPEKQDNKAHVYIDRDEAQSLVDQGYKLHPQISLRELHADNRYYFNIAVDPDKGQTISTLEEAFEKAGFDKRRPKESMDIGFGTIFHGASYWPPNEHRDTAEALIHPHEAQSLTDQGYALQLAI